MKTKLAINGFGRIGRLVLRALLEHNKYSNFDIVAINDINDISNNALLLQYDSVHGKLNNDITLENDNIIIDQHKIKYLQEHDPTKLPWQELGIDIVLECSGVFNTKSNALKHIDAGAKKVLISAPATDVDLTVVFGVNHTKINKGHTILSNSSCTTNCLAPVAKIINDNFEIINGFMTTIHSYTSDQRLVDNNHKDLRRARASSLSIIPTTTGAAKSIGLILPELNNKIDGTAIRVPTPNVSAVDFTFLTKHKITKQSLKKHIDFNIQNDFKGIVDCITLPLVSCDYNHNEFSAVIDFSETYIVNDNFARVLIWYDNEWGFANRMLDTTNIIAQYL